MIPAHVMVTVQFGDEPIARLSIVKGEIGSTSVGMGGRIVIREDQEQPEIHDFDPDEMIDLNLLPEPIITLFDMIFVIRKLFLALPPRERDMMREETKREMKRLTELVARLSSQKCSPVPLDD